MNSNPSKPARPMEEGADLFDLAELRQRLTAAGGDSSTSRAAGSEYSSMFPPPAGDSQLTLELQRLWDDERGPWRSHLFGSHEIAAAIDTLTAKAPNLTTFFRELARPCALSIATRTPLRVDPVLLIGPPGVGKTWAVKGVGAALQTKAKFIAAEAMSDLKSSLCGLAPFWSRARKGLIASILLDGPTTSPIIVLDEVDKVREVTSTMAVGGTGIDVLHGLLEAENASDFQDEFLEIRLRADRIIWILTANDISALPPSILDRVMIVRVEAPDPEAARTIIRAMFEEAADEFGDAFDHRLPSVAVEALCELNPRRIKRAIRRSFGIAAVGGRSWVSIEDVKTAVAEVSDPVASRSRPIGFVQHRQKSQ
ncbi:MAG: ATPase AAA [Xanthobacteraceae bacterium]|nr:MAG: ATPase AAA [Xanthobacteraceae bacterium]